MKVKIALVLRIALLLTACTSNSIDKSSLSRQMRQAEELVNVNPDSALHILQAMPEEDALPLLLLELFVEEFLPDDNLIRLL